MAIPLFFIFLFMEQDAGTNTNSKKKIWIEKELTSGHSHTSPTLELVPGAAFKTKCGNKIVALPVLRTREP